MDEGDSNDAYPTCEETFSTLCVFSDELGPDDITRILHIEPTQTFRKGDSHGKGRLPREANGWFYCTQELCDSKDTRRHIDMILRVLDGKIDSVQELHNRGCKLDITSYYVSTGQGGPWLMPEQMLQLGRLGISVWWDVYFSDEDET